VWPFIVAAWGMTSAEWSFPAAVAVAIVALAACLSIWDWFIRRRAKPVAEWSPFPPDWHAPLQEVLRQNYMNEEVKLDGKRFLECTFSNVRFFYQGMARFEMINCNFSGKGVPIIGTGSPAIAQMISFMNTLKMIPGELKYDIRKAGTPR
jgi:hypothetical protein